MQKLKTNILQYASTRVRHTYTTKHQFSLKTHPTVRPMRVLFKVISFFSFGFNSRQHSLPSRKYPAAHTSFPIHLCVLAATSTSLPWKAHECLRASWLLTLGEFESQTEAAVVEKRKKSFAHIYFEQEFSSDIWFIHLMICICRMLVSIGESFGVCAALVCFYQDQNQISHFSHVYFLFFCFLPSFCRCLIAFRRSTRWSTVATAPVRGAWIWAQLQNLWRGYDLIWMGRMRLMAGLSWM